MAEVVGSTYLLILCLEFTDNMRHDQMKWQEITILPCFCFPQQYQKNSSNKPESHFVQRVNTCKGCWYHSKQDHDPSLMPSNQVKWQDVTLPPCVCSLQ